MIASDRLGQTEIEQHRVGKAKRRRKEKRNVNSPTAQDAADRWSKNETETKRRADQAHAFRAILAGGDVGDVGWRGRDVAAGDAVENASGKKHPDRIREAEAEKTDAGADDRKKEHGPAAVFV